MVKPVSLSNPAFAALRAEKRESESDSDVVLRLAQEARASRRNPRSFLQYKPGREVPLKNYAAWARAMNEADRSR